MTNPLRRGIAETYYRSVMADQLPGVQYGEPVGDAGMFGPDSVIWYVNGDVSGVMGGISGLVLGALDPVVLHGTQSFSSYAVDGAGRLGRTVSFVTAATYAAAPVVEATMAQVRAMHRKVKGTTPDGTPYAADDPALLNWVYTTIAYGILSAHLRYHPKPISGADLDIYFAEWSVIAAGLGASGGPKTLAEVEAYFAERRPQLACNDATREVEKFFRTPYGPTVGARAASRVVSVAAFDLLPRWAKELYTVPERGAAVRPAAHALLRTLRYALGESPIVRESRQRALGAPVGGV